MLPGTSAAARGSRPEVQPALTSGLLGDTMTAPTHAMLEAIQNCTLQDDVMQEDATTNNLEQHLAELTGKEAGLFTLSGTMGNQLAMRALLTQPPYAVLSDSRSHIVMYEAGSASSLSGAMMVRVTPSNGMHLTLEDIIPHVTLGDDIHTCPTRVISLENTLDGLIFPPSEIYRIAAYASEHSIKLHCDGARLWEAVAAGSGTLRELCTPFDTVTMCFSKGLGAPAGSILVGSASVIKHARWTRKAIGGGVRQPGLLTAAARVAVDTTFGVGPGGEGGKLKAVHEVARKVESLWAGFGGKVTCPVHTNMVWLDLAAAGCSDARFVGLMEAEQLKAFGSRLVVHHQVVEMADQVLEKLERVFRKATDRSEGDPGTRKGQKNMYKLH
ncbi:l-allo-threonine aldolase [Ceratocystis lukuohia]|uniref:L-allo-threonine aldolase n=1 Tax=Ceratocystis lukuohia TaxID=2019550 RepID=A0ABR4MAU1_9PEZI